MIQNNSENFLAAKNCHPRIYLTCAFCQSSLNCDWYWRIHWGVSYWNIVTNTSVTLLLRQWSFYWTSVARYDAWGTLVITIFLNRHATWSMSSKLETVTSGSIGTSHPHASFALFVATKQPSLLRIDRITSLSMWYIHKQHTHTHTRTCGLEDELYTTERL